MKENTTPKWVRCHVFTNLGIWKWHTGKITFTWWSDLLIEDTNNGNNA